MGSSLAVRLAPESIASSTEANIFQNTAPGLENTNHSNHTYSLRSVLSGTHHEEIGASWQNDCEGNVACLQPDAWSLSCEIHTMDEEAACILTFTPMLGKVVTCSHLHNTHKQVNQWRNKLKYFKTEIHADIITIIMKTTTSTPQI